MCLVILVLPVAAMDSESYCTSCKAMEPEEKTLANSVHTGITCTECHIPPGFTSAMGWRFREAKNIWADYLGVPAASDKGHLPANDNCLSCHPLKGIPNEGSDVRMNHAQHLEVRGLLCIDCHDTVSHKLPGQPSGVRMLTCAMCHNQQGAPNGCEFCHTVAPRSGHAPDFMKQHGQKALLNEEDCLRCHHDKEAFCDTCHGYPPTSHYSGTWRYHHSADAEDNPTNCEACHDDAYCAQCHSVNHPSGWLDSHGGIAAKGVSACLVCHPRGMCDECHDINGVTL
jgi:hypothetical protein